MSAGAFVNSKYEADNGDIYFVRVQPETLALTVNATANTAPTDPIDQQVSAKVSKTRREIGIGCRGVGLRFDGAVPDGYKPGSTLFVPVLQKGLYDTIDRGSVITYLSNTATLVYKTAETVR